LASTMGVEVVSVKTVVLGPRPPELDALIARRHALGQDRFDEVWEGEYHMVPGPQWGHAEVDQSLAEILGPLARAQGLRVGGSTNIGREGNYRVPDRLVARHPIRGVYQPTAAMVVEVLSPDDETFEKFGFYAAHGVDEILVADPAERTVRLWRLGGAAEGAAREYLEVDRSDLLDIRADDLRDQITWP